MKIQHNPYHNRNTYSVNDLIERQDRLKRERLEYERNRVEHIERVRKIDSEKGNNVDVKV